MPCTKRMIRCRPGCAHRELVLDYIAERERQEIAAEDDYRNRDGNDRATPLVTFKDWLIAHRRAA